MQALEMKQQPPDGACGSAAVVEQRSAVRVHRIAHILLERIEKVVQERGGQIMTGMRLPQGGEDVGPAGVLSASSALERVGQGLPVGSELGQTL